MNDIKTTFIHLTNKSLALFAVLMCFILNFLHILTQKGLYRPVKYLVRKTWNIYLDVIRSRNVVVGDEVVNGPYLHRLLTCILFVRLLFKAKRTTQQQLGHVKEGDFRLVTKP